MALATCEIVWIQSLLKNLRVEHSCPALLYCDNEATLHIAANSVYRKQTKHIELNCHFIRKKIQEGIIKTMHVSTYNQLADLLTKALHPK